MRIVVLTSSPRGRAAACLAALRARAGLEVAAVIVARRDGSRVKRLLWRKLRKTARIGPLGALNGLRLRRWYAHEPPGDLTELAPRLGVPVVETESIHCEATRRHLEDAHADLGVSWGNDYIPKSVFSIPRHGMINVHEEILPRFRGARSVIWPIHEGLVETGFTIHQMDATIDAGPILFQKSFPIVFHRRLSDTVRENHRRIVAEVPAALAFVCENYPALAAEARPQTGGKTFTTPSFSEFLRILRMHRRLYRRFKADRRNR